MRVRPVQALVTAALILAAAVAPSTLSSASSASPAAGASRVSQETYLIAVHTRHPLRAAARLQRRGYDLLENRVGRNLFVLADVAAKRQLRRDGFSFTVKKTLTPLSASLQRTFYGGYKTADEYVASMDATAAAHPDKAIVYDIGDSWLKTVTPTLGNDLKVICLTKLQPGDCQLSPTSVKPRFFLMATIHARELTPTEIADRWITELVTRYGVDAEITALMDHTELWVLPLVNPDGREIAEPGTPTPYLQRKNANDTLGTCASPPTSSNHYGIDLNRNHSFLWGGVGTSTDPCAATYRGTSAASEPETQALQTLLTQLFADNRGPALADAAPSGTPGLMMTLHSYGNLVLFPWGHVNTASPNDAGLRNMAFRLNWFNGYTAGQPGQVLYNTSGTSDDWAYGQLGVAATTVEVGPSSGTCSGFVPAYSCQASFWSANRGMLVYAAQLARQPYTLSLGPNTRSVAVSASTVPAGSPVTVTATGQDSAYGSSGVGRPSSQRVNAGEYYVDVPPWAGGTGVAMTATDGRFSSSTEGIRATISTTGLSAGVHTVFVRSRDLNGNWGPVSAVRFTVS